MRTLSVPVPRIFQPVSRARGISVMLSPYLVPLGLTNGVPAIHPSQSCSTSSASSIWTVPRSLLNSSRHLSEVRPSQFQTLRSGTGLLFGSDITP